MREAVLIGPAAYVEAARQQLRARTQALVVDLDLTAALQAATDPFFVSEAGSARAFQVMRSTKLELRLALADAQMTAAASFNLHARHFTKPLDIRGDDAAALLETGCVGWGLERWMAAVVTRWGAAPEAWPAQIWSW